MTFTPTPTTRRRTMLRRSLPLLLGLMIAATLSLWPEIQCAAQGQLCTDPRDLWCNGDCSQACQSSTSLGMVVSCSPFDPGGGVIYCDDDWQPDTCAVRCSDADNCNVTDLRSGGECSGRLGQQGNYSVWNVKRCPSYGSDPTCKVRDRNTRVDCCTGSGGGGPPPCTPSFGPPTITLAGHTPAHPLPIGQDPDELGVDITMLVEGGRDTACGTGQRTLTSITPPEAALSAESIKWIEGELRRTYPGAEVLGTYPLFPDYPVPQLPADTATITFHLDPQDPGDYELTLTATQDDGQTTASTLTVHVHLFEATITE